MSKYDRITTEELAVESLLAERRKIENAVYRSGVALRDALDDCDVNDDVMLERLSEQLADHIGLRQKLSAHVNKHGAEIFEDLYSARRLAEAREERV